MQKSKKQLRILFTDVGHPVTGGTLTDLRNEKEDFYFVGIDNTKDTMGFLWVDKFYIISNPSDPNYIKDLLNIAVKERIDLIIPWTNEEALLIAKNSKVFEKEGIKLLNNTEEKISSVIDKGLMFENLKVKGFPTPNFRSVSDLEEIEKAVKDFGYPEKSIVVKPRSLSGERGFCIIDNKPELDKRGFGNKLPLKAFLSLLEESGKTTNLEYVVMDFLEGEDYSVDCLCKNGESIFIIPRTRINAMGGVSLIGETTDDPKIREQVQRVIKEFDFSFNVNIQLKYKKDTPFIYDINPRISGTIVANSGAGINLLYFGIKVALNEPIPGQNNIKYKGVKMVRYWDQKFIKTNKEFKP